MHVVGTARHTEGWLQWALGSFVLEHDEQPRLGRCGDVPRLGRWRHGPNRVGRCPKVGTMFLCASLAAVSVNFLPKEFLQVNV